MNQAVLEPVLPGDLIFELERIKISFDELHGLVLTLAKYVVSHVTTLASSNRLGFQKRAQEGETWTSTVQVALWFGFRQD